MDITTVGVDLAKDLITVYAQDRQGHGVMSRNFKFTEFATWLIQLPAGCLVAWKPVPAPITGAGACWPWDCSRG